MTPQQHSRLIAYVERHVATIDTIAASMRTTYAEQVSRDLGFTVGEQELATAYGIVQARTRYPRSFDGGLKARKTKGRKSRGSRPGKTRRSKR